MKGLYVKGMEMPKDGVYLCEIGVAGDIATLTIHGGIEEERKAYPFIAVSDHEDIANAPTIEPKKGRWIKMSDADGIYWACSECGEDIPRVVTQYNPRYDAYPRLESINPTAYCPHCGVKMERQK